PPAGTPEAVDEPRRPDRRDEDDPVRHRDAEEAPLPEVDRARVGGSMPSRPDHAETGDDEEEVDTEVAEPEDVHRFAVETGPDPGVEEQDAGDGDPAQSIDVADSNPHRTAPVAAFDLRQVTAGFVVGLSDAGCDNVV